VLTDGQLAIEAAVLLTSPFTPMLFMGEEWAARTPFQFFTDFSDPDMGEAVREGRTREFGSHGWEDLYGGPISVPDPQSLSTFEASRLDWSEPSRPRHARMLEFHRALIALRAQVPDIAADDRAATAVEFDPADRSWFVVHRGAVAVVVNLAAEPREVPLPGAEHRGVLLAWAPPTLVAGAVGMPGHGVAVLGPGAA
jgi:maltooligosyltrehalose trehalohydrolase